AAEVLTEAVQTVMRKHGVAEPYEQLKAATRGKQLDRALFQKVLETVELPAAARLALQQLTPADYIGIADRLTRGLPDEIARTAPGAKGQED
ncbi:MAG: hypothetical protein OES38_19665, partial [Gammaproteobacteria bacterium]|nr:hypothetical protein [Gammaproteobacteria bacterium]